MTGPKSWVSIKYKEKMWDPRIPFCLEDSSVALALKMPVLKLKENILNSHTELFVYYFIERVSGALHTFSKWEI